MNLGNCAQKLANAFLVCCLSIAISCFLSVNVIYAAEAETGPMILDADKIENFEDQNLVVATGNVQIDYNKRMVNADKVTLNKLTKEVIAEGRVKIIEPSGEIVFAKRISLGEKFESGFFEKLRILLVENDKGVRPILAADSAVRSKGYLTKMKKAIFTPCKICEEPGSEPLWQIKALEVIHDQKRHDIIYKHAWLEFLGMPTVYVPYFRHPDPTVDKRSGFLAYKYRSSTELGSVTSIPYYYVVNPYLDITVEPTYTQLQSIGVFAGETRAAFDWGKLDVSGSITYADRLDAAGVIEERFRGHLFAKGNFDINKTWRWNFDLARQTDDQYLSLYYPLESKQVLKSTNALEGFRERNYASLSTTHFQDNRPDIDKDTVPKILPMVEFNGFSKPTRKGSRWSFDVNALNLMRSEGVQSRRMVSELGWLLPVYGKSGNFFKISGSLRGDIYETSNVPISQGTATNLNHNEVTGRVDPKLLLEWERPIFKHIGQTYILIEPKTSIILGTNQDNPEAISNEDSKGFEFDKNDLFIKNRLPGYDVIEPGQRIDYGIKIGSYSGEENASLFLGQSYRLRTDGTFKAGSGVQDDFSDYVGNAEINVNNFELLYYFRFDKDDLSPRTNELQTSAGPPEFRLGVNYLDMNPFSASGTYDERQEISYNIGSQFTEFWSASAGGNHDLQSGNIMSVSTSINYLDECFGLDISFGRSYSRDREIEPSDSIMVSLFFKELGTFSQNQSLATQ